jgi:hypothetical protein
MSKRDINQFRAWLRNQLMRQDSVGDFARDFLLDDCAVDVRTLSGLDRHLAQEHCAPDKVLHARDRAWREYASTPPPAPSAGGGIGE